MTDAPKRISIRPHRIKASELAQDSQWTDAREYHLARPGQPCSTDEFLRTVSNARCLGRIDNAKFIASAFLWNQGDFTAAMEGLE